MRIVHWTSWAKSGMNRVAEDIVNVEKSLGFDSFLINRQETTEAQDKGVTADIHVAHTFIPSYLWHEAKVVWVAHTTPEHSFRFAVEEGLGKGYGAGDSWMLMQHYLQNADAVVTFWERHAKIWESLSDKGKPIYCFPLGVDKKFWKPQQSLGKYAGKPSVFSAETPYPIKSPLDLINAWGLVNREVPDAVLHLVRFIYKLHRWFFPLLNRIGTSHSAFLSPDTFSHAELCNAFNSIDYYIGLVRYGDYNRLSLEAKACGCKTISYRGNPYSDYWITEGDQRIIAQELIDIFTGKTEPREHEEVPNVEDTAKNLIKVYERIA